MFHQVPTPNSLKIILLSPFGKQGIITHNYIHSNKSREKPFHNFFCMPICAIWILKFPII